MEDSFWGQKAIALFLAEMRSMLSLWIEVLEYESRDLLASTIVGLGVLPSRELNVPVGFWASGRDSSYKETKGQRQDLSRRDAPSKDKP
jgi:hypothetical protein